jgi:hypothetical protein
MRPVIVMVYALNAVAAHAGCAAVVAGPLSVGYMRGPHVVASSSVRNAAELRCNISGRDAVLSAVNGVRYVTTERNGMHAT